MKTDKSDSMIIELQSYLFSLEPNSFSIPPNHEKDHDVILN